MFAVLLSVITVLLILDKAEVFPKRGLEFYVYARAAGMVRQPLRGAVSLKACCHAAGVAAHVVAKWSTVLLVRSAGRELARPAHLVLSGFVGRANIARLSTITTAALGNCSKAILVHVSNRMSVPWLVIELPAILFHAAWSLYLLRVTS
jgi:hypothetical protein